MVTMNDLIHLHMQQQIAQELLYREQIVHRLPDPFPPMLPLPVPRHVIMPPRVPLPGVEMTLQNDELWKQFHQIGTEMIITKSGRRMFPSMRLSVSGLEEETNYCVLMEMVPIGDCRYKFSGSQWVPAGGAEPQSPQRMYLHPDSPATGAHWQAQPILFNKVKLTNNTLDNSGHIVLASMHKYQPRLHVVRTADLRQMTWAPRQAFIFAETEFVAVTAYQNDRITKLKIDNNPFAKGFRETGQSRCKRKMSSSPTDDDQDLVQTHSQSSGSLDMSPGKSTMTLPTAAEMATTSSSSSNNNNSNNEQDGPQIKRLRSNGSACSLSSSLDGAEPLAGPPAPGASSFGSPPGAVTFMQNFQQNMQTLLRPSLVDLACTYFGRPAHEYNGATQASYLYPPTSILQAALPALPAALGLPHNISVQQTDETTADELELDVGSETIATTATRTTTAAAAEAEATTAIAHSPHRNPQHQPPEAPAKRKGFSISAILGGGS